MTFFSDKRNLQMWFPGKGKPKSVGESHLPLSPDPYPFRLSRHVQSQGYAEKVQISKKGLQNGGKAICSPFFLLQGNFKSDDR